MGTTAVNVGINDNLLDLTLRFQMPRDLPTAFQEQGRGSRVRGRPSTYHIMYCLRSFQHMMMGYHLPKSKEARDNVSLQVEFVEATSQVLPIAELAKQMLEKKKKKSKNQSAPLSKADKRLLCARQIRELTKVVQFYCLDIGCQQMRKEHYLATVRLTLMQFSGERCHTACTVCTGEWSTIHLPIYKESLLAFFQSSVGRDSFPFVCEAKPSASSPLARRHVVVCEVCHHVGAQCFTLTLFNALCQVEELPVSEGCAHSHAVKPTCLNYDGTHTVCVKRGGID